MDRKVMFEFEDFENIVIRPIQAAYRTSAFLGRGEERYADYWYDILKYYDKDTIADRVKNYTREYRELPVLANICYGLEILEPCTVRENITDT